MSRLRVAFAVDLTSGTAETCLPGPVDAPLTRKPFLNQPFIERLVSPRIVRASSWSFESRWAKAFLGT